VTAPLAWFSFRDHAGRAWRVGLSCAEDSPDLEDANGWSYFESAAALVDVEQTRSEQDAITLHEILHVAMGDDHDPAEERIVTTMAPRLLPILRQLGLKFPRRPRGVAALERRARDEEDEDA
jgi:hypothetical protein